MKHSFAFVAVVFLLLVFSGLGYIFIPPLEIDKTFLTIATFLFSIFTGFFISRQASRFNRVRETVTAFDGKISSVYRAAGHINKKLQTAIGKVVSVHYNRILETGQWNIHFVEKSDTISKIHGLLDKHVEEETVTKLSNQALGAIVKGLAACQSVRKQMVALNEERIPTEQWLLIWFFAGMLLFTVAMIDSSGNLHASILKGAFGASIFSVLLILYRLNELVFSEKIMGKRSAEDVLGIIDGSK